MNPLKIISQIPFVNRLSLRTKLVLSFLFVVLGGGVLSSFIGTRLVANTIILQAHNKVKHDLNTAWLVYNEALSQVRDVIHLTASGRTIPDCLESGRLKDLEEFLSRRRQQFGLDFLTLTDARGITILRTRPPFLVGDDRSSDLFIQKVLRGETVFSTAIAAREELQREGGDLAERAFIPLVPAGPGEESSGEGEIVGMVLMAAVPVTNDQGRLLGVLYGGTLLNRNYQMVDKIRDLLYGEERYKGREMGTATIFRGARRIATNVRNEKGERALGTRVSKEVYEAVLQRGQRWVDRAFVVKDWYITAYDPIRDLSGKIIGMLYVGMFEAPYIDLRNKVVYSFFAIGVLGIVFVLILSFFITTGITRPLREMVRATHQISEGDLSLELPIGSQDEMGRLAESFNHMLVRLKEARRELEDYGRTLEEKVDQRSQQLQKIQTQLMQSEKLASLGRLASGVAHEINSPLTGILTFSHLLLRRLQDRPELQGELELIIRETTRVSTIVRGLLDFARESKPQKKSCDLNELMVHTLSLVERQAAFHDIRITRNLHPTLPRVILDANQIQQVFMNILLNAADAMPGGGSLHIATDLSPEESRIRVCFADTGCGIPEKDLHRIFDPFFTTKADKKGTGLGLAVSYGIIEGHGGRIEVQSVEGKGTTFAITLPLKAAEQEKMEE